MSYDSEDMPADAPRGPVPSGRFAHPQDLEGLVTLLEITAIDLTFEPDATFTEAELLNAAMAMCGPEPEVQRRDLQIVTRSMKWRRFPGGRLALK